MAPEDLQTLLVATSSVVSAMLGAVLSILYRDFRDRPRLRVSLDTFMRTRNPITLPPDIQRQMRFQGSFHSWLDDIVKWKARQAFADGEFQLSQLRDLRHLGPQFLAKCESELAEAREMKTEMTEPKSPPSQAQAETLARVRAYWQNAFKEDVFIAYQEHPEGVAQRLVANFDGDIQQTQSVINAVTRLVDWLEAGLNPQANPATRIVATPQQPESPRKPFVHIDLLAVNSGRTETLIPDHAQLHCGDLSIALRGYSREYGYEVFHGKFWRVKPNEVEELVFSQDPDHTTQSQLNQLRDLIEQGSASGLVEIHDYAGRRTRTSKFLLRDVVE